jgi:replicative DNA helicase
MINENWIQQYLEAGDVQLENILLCKILVQRKIFPDILPEYFTGSRERFFRAIEMQWTKNKVIDPILLKADFWENVEGALKENGSSSVALLDRLHSLWQKREIAKMIFEVGELDTPDEILANLQITAGNIALKKSGNKYDHSEAIQRLLKILEKAQTNNNQLSGYSTGLSELDKYTSGIERGKTYFIGALKKSGKSRFAVYLSIKLAEQGAGIIFNSLEMNETQLNTCALSSFSGIDSNNFGRSMSSKTYSTALIKINNLVDLNWTISREKIVANLRARILEVKNKKPVDVVFIDFVQRMQHEAESRTKEVEAVAMELADLSREQDVAVIGLTQLTGMAERLGDDEMPNMSHMKESQAIAENGDCLLTLHNFDRRENPFDENGAYRLQEIYCLIEQRYDVSGVCFRFLGDMRNCQFVNHSEPYTPRNKNDK